MNMSTSTDTIMQENSEAERLAALHELGILDTNTSEYFDSITRLAVTLFGMSASYVSLVDRDRQWLKSNVGICPHDGKLGESFCAHAINASKVMVVEDTLLDERFRHNEMVTGPAGTRFYAGAPMLTREGDAIGALCVTDTKPRRLDEEQLAKLQSLASLAMSHVSLRRTVGHVDAVSGMPNKYQLEEDLVALQTEAAGQRRVLVYLDMPDAATAFEIASVLGPAVYDELIRSVSLRLRRLFIGKARVYHVTDARFAILSSDADTAGFVRFVYGLEPALHEPVHSREVPLNLPGFGGIVEFDVDAHSALEAPRKALSAVNQALLLQQRWSVYSIVEDSSHQRSFRLLNDVHDAIRDDGLHLVYQPKHDLHNDSCASAEALLRWTHPELGPISPAEFIPLIEKTALIKPLTDWVIRTAFRQAGAWHAAGHKIKIAINLSAHNFEEEDICERLEAASKEAGLEPQYIEIECTEGIWMESPQIIQTLEAIRALGMGLALDDFGTGYSNFSYLQKVPASVVKLDQSLIRNVHTSLRDQRIVRSLIALAKELDYHVVAEGVETADSLAMIRSWGCDVAQGYHFSRPLLAEEFLRHVQKFTGTLAAISPMPAEKGSLHPVFGPLLRSVAG
ncbi:sensor domain-containing phosphodiesterase [Undibacterium terreum]|uniref:Sensor domain-containing phosphodiesterase n=1 Tax=Undibacterium terreum TaxID=1224302 RepID=A0A916V017_9BURK|nr:GGDEF and EAL domain-containing protein [Undibacterium terreum]GGC96759.1 sensor domain-containing phosphodiesterase [Undibacterium terreum]